MKVDMIQDNGVGRNNASRGTERKTGSELRVS